MKRCLVSYIPYTSQRRSSVQALTGIFSVADGEESLLHQGINACRRCPRSNSIFTHSPSVHAENQDEPLCLVVSAQGSTPSHLHLLPAPVGLPILHGLAHFVSASWPGRNPLSTTMQLCLV